MTNEHVSAKAMELYVIGALDAERCLEVEAHVASCASCAEALMGEARVELAFEQIAQAGPRAGGGASRRDRPVRRLALTGGAVGTLAMAAAMLLWLAPSSTGAPASARPPASSLDHDVVSQSFGIGDGSAATAQLDARDLDGR